MILDPVPGGQDVSVPPRLAACVPLLSLARSRVAWPRLRFRRAETFPRFAAWQGLANGCPAARYLSPAPCICASPYLLPNALPVLINWEHA